MCHRPCPALGRSRQRRAARRRSVARGDDGAADLRQRRARLGSRRARGRRAAARQPTPFAAACGRSRRCSVDMRDVYAATHWAVTGQPPAYHTPDEDVYLPGRNIILLARRASFARRPASNASSSARSSTILFPTRRPSSARRWRRRSRSALRTCCDVDAPYRERRAKRTSSGKAGARRSVRAHAVVYEAGWRERIAARAASAASVTMRFWKRSRGSDDVRVGGVYAGIDADCAAWRAAPMAAASASSTAVVIFSPSIMGPGSRRPSSHRIGSSSRSRALP